MLPYPTRFPENPPLHKPWRFLAWVARRQLGLLVLAGVLATVNFAALALTPYILALAIDSGLDNGLTSQMWLYAGALLGLGVITALAAAARHVGEVANWMRAHFTTANLVGTHVTRTGSRTTSNLSTGEVVATVATDAVHVGNLMESLPMSVGGLLAYVMIAFLMLSESTALGLAVMIGLPVVTAIVALLIPPLQKRQAAHREATGKLTEMASDTVAGLRVLRGIGGEDVFTARYTEQSQNVRRAGVSVANTQSILAALQVLLPGAFVVGVVWFGAALAVRGDLTVGQLVAFYGYTAFLADPLRQITMFIQFLTRANVAAKKFLAVLVVVPAAGTLGENDADAGPLPLAAARDEDRGLAGTPPESAYLLYDAGSGLGIRPGAFTVVVSPSPDHAAGLVRRFARLDDAESAAVTVAGRRLTELPLAQVRETIVLSDTTPELFTGTLRREVDAWDRDDSRALLEALAVADARDVLESLPEGVDGEITEKGRSLSGGQRQRVALARAVMTDAPVLLLLEPTSAVDAHTERRIATQLVRHRRGATTVVVSSSPLVLEHADDVVFVDASGIRARGTHRALMDRAYAGDLNARAYRGVVTRKDEEAENATASR